MMQRSLLSLFFTAIITFVATSVSSFSHVSIESKCASPATAFTRFNSSPLKATPKCLARSHASSLSAGPVVIEKPKTEKKQNISKDKQKKSKNTKSKGWAVRLYNDPMNKREFVARCLTEVCALNDGAAYQVMMQAHQLGVAVIGQYHLEMAELYRDQLLERGLVIDMIPVDDDK